MKEDLSVCTFVVAVLTVVVMLSVFARVLAVEYVVCLRGGLVNVNLGFEKNARGVRQRR